MQSAADVSESVGMGWGVTCSSSSSSPDRMGADRQDKPQNFHPCSCQHEEISWQRRSKKWQGGQDNSPSRQQQQEPCKFHTVSPPESPAERS